MPKGLDPLSHIPQIRKKPSVLTREQKDKLWAERMHRHAHNGMYGGTHMARRNMINIQTAKSTTPEAKALAYQIEGLLCTLGQVLYTQRVELDGSVVTPNHKGDEELERLREGR
jgi:hypothetical protein